jgi:hypothetical protein
MPCDVCSPNLPAADNKRQSKLSLHQELNHGCFMLSLTIPCVASVKTLRLPPCSYHAYPRSHKSSSAIGYQPVESRNLAVLLSVKRKMPITYSTIVEYTFFEFLVVYTLFYTIVKSIISFSNRTSRLEQQYVIHHRQWTWEHACSFFISYKKMQQKYIKRLGERRTGLTGWC